MTNHINTKKQVDTRQDGTGTDNGITQGPRAIKAYALFLREHVTSTCNHKQGFKKVSNSAFDNFRHPFLKNH